MHAQYTCFNLHILCTYMSLWHTTRNCTATLAVDNVMYTEHCMYMYYVHYCIIIIMRCTCTYIHNFNDMYIHKHTYSNSQINANTVKLLRESLRSCVCLCPRLYSWSFTHFWHFILQNVSLLLFARSVALHVIWMFQIVIRMPPVRLLLISVR